MRNRHFQLMGLFAASLAVVSCGGLHEMQGALQDLQKVQQDLVKATGRDDIRVSLNNGSLLSISVVNSPWKELPLEQKRTKALEVARIGYNSYASRSALRAVSVNFAVHRSYAGIFTYDESGDSFSFEAPQLTGAAPPSASRI
jgi:hypothetical protein